MRAHSRKYLCGLIQKNIYVDPLKKIFMRTHSRYIYLCRLTQDIFFHADSLKIYFLYKLTQDIFMWTHSRYIFYEVSFKIFFMWAHSGYIFYEVSFKIFFMRSHSRYFL